MIYTEQPICPKCDIGGAGGADERQSCDAGFRRRRGSPRAASNARM